MIILFFISYLPLFVILFIQNVRVTDSVGKTPAWRTILAMNVVPAVFLLLSLLSIFAYFIIFYFISRYGFKTPEKVLKVKNTGIEYLSYLGTYIIPFIGMRFDTTNNTIATWVLIGVIAFIYPKTNLIYANPTLALFGFNIYKVTLQRDPDEEVVIITRQSIKKNASYRFKDLADDIFFAKP